MVNRKYFILYFAVIVLWLGGCAHQEISSTKRIPCIAAQSLNMPAIWPNSAPAIHARHAILIDVQSGRTIFQKNADVRTPVASTQKLLTALLVTERGNLDTPISIHREDVCVEGTRLHLRVGDRYTRRELLNAMLVTSMNDAASALGRDAAGSTGAVGPAMTRLAQSLGANNSLFLNASGLPAAQYSTARDMARVALGAYHDSIIRQIVRKPTYLFQYANGRTDLLKTTNLLLHRSTIYNGLKTGDTKASGRCLITSATRNGRAFILVQLGSQTRYIFNDAERMIAWAFRKRSRD